MFACSSPRFLSLQVQLPDLVDFLPVALLTTENGRSLKALTFLSWGSKTQAQSGKGHGRAKARHLGLHHGFCGPQTPSPAPAPEEGRVQRPASWQGSGKGLVPQGLATPRCPGWSSLGLGSVAKGHASWL